jgi:outer membrane protein TolC
LAIQRRRQEQLSRALAIQESRFELGEVSGSEVTQLRLAKVGESARTREQEVQVRLILGRLRARVESDEFDAVVGDLEALTHLEVAALPSESSLEDLVETSPAVVSAKLRADLEEATSRLVRRIAWGRPVVEAEWQRIPDMGGIEGFDALGLQLAVPLPLGKGAQRAIAAAEARADMASQSVELVRREVRSWLHNELATGQGAAQTLAELMPELAGLPRTREALTQQFALGAISYLVYLDGQARLDSVELQGVEARRTLLRSRLSMALLLEQESLFPIPSFNAEVEP